jgi:hypothetical protein
MIPCKQDAAMKNPGGTAVSRRAVASAAKRKGQIALKSMQCSAPAVLHGRQQQIRRPLDP